MLDNPAFSLYLPDFMKVVPEKIQSEQRDLYPYKEKNLLQKQLESDKKPFPVILDSLKRYLQIEAADYRDNLHNLIRIILSLHIEKNKVLANNPYINKSLLHCIYNIDVEEIIAFMHNCRKNNSNVTKNNIALIKYAFYQLVNKRQLMMSRNKRSYHVKKIKNSMQMELKFYS